MILGGNFSQDIFSLRNYFDVAKKAQVQDLALVKRAFFSIDLRFGALKFWNFSRKMWPGFICLENEALHLDDSGGSLLDVAGVHLERSRKCEPSIWKRGFV